MYQHFFRYMIEGWSFDPIALGALLIGSVLYFRGEKALTIARRRSGLRLQRLPAERRYFVASILLLIIAFDSPIDFYSQQYFWVHMIQHVMLMVIIPPLFVLSDPWLKSLRGLPRPIRGSVGRFVSSVVRSKFGKLVAVSLGSLWGANLLMNGSMWFWHLPFMYDLALEHLYIHYCEHFCFFWFGVLFFFRIMDPNPYRKEANPIRKVGHLWLAAMSSMILAMLLGLSYGAWYTFYAHIPGRTLSLVADQQIGAGIMWVFGGIPFFLIGVSVLKKWLDREEENGEDSLSIILHGVVARSVGRAKYVRNEGDKVDERMG